MGHSRWKFKGSEELVEKKEDLVITISESHRAGPAACDESKKNVYFVGGKRALGVRGRVRCKKKVI